MVEGFLPRFLNKTVSLVAYQHRMLLRDLMVHYGFNPYFAEWWHFTLKNEPFPHTYFNFPIEPMPISSSAD